MSGARTLSGVLRRLKRLFEAWREYRGGATKLSLEELVERVAGNLRKHETDLVWSIQKPRELLDFARAVQDSSPRVVVEIGTAMGGTLAVLARVAAPDALLVSIDLPGGPFGGGYSAWRKWLYARFARSGQSLELLRLDSHDPATLDRLRRLLGGKSIDLLFLDGDHSYEGVRDDFEMYGALMARNGMIALHDIRPPAEAETVGVPRFWQELEARFRTLELVEDDGPAGFGIGIVFLSTEAAERMRTNAD